MKWQTILSPTYEEDDLLTEQQVERTFRNLFKVPGFPPEALEKAEQLVDQLRPESPLRHRLSEELDELRQLCLSER